MKKYKLIISFENTYKAESEEEAKQQFWEDLNYGNEIPSSWIADQIIIKEIKN